MTFSDKLLKTKKYLKCNFLINDLLLNLLMKMKTLET